MNGKFLSGIPTGVHRVAEELITHAAALIAEDAVLARQLRLTLLVPANAAAKAQRLGLPYRVIGPLTGNPWEQCTLPLRAGDATILSLCNVGPMLSRDAITMFHDAQVHLAPDSYSPAFRSWYRLHQPISGRRHRRILTVSHFSREQLARLAIAPAGRIDVVHNGVDHVLATTPDPAVLARLGLTDRPYAIALANTQPHKNIGLLLRAFHAPELADIGLVLFGSAGAGDFAAAGHPVPANVTFAGRVSDGELRALYAGALCIAFPSLTEGFGLPPLEAMTTGCPAIVAPHGALPEICGDAALYAPGDDPAPWTQAIAALAGDPALRQRLSEAAVRQSAGFTWKRAASQLIEALLRP